ncbi:YhgE/Pip domain-containing protein [Enterococcus asini]|uniref:YhgE/Pip domain-containing protein n=1 Tax=Enterococcus asini TaxID=57732 RepID=UPI00289279A9|nr:YhgE/Pip domain-containing protein [Enterococcus asini]MDT2757405.1 YhgE/Pip domain-containing protein [Enterococcus asini]
MKKIKHVFELYKLDWKRIAKSPVAVFLIVALMILPSLYAWFNIKALWDPYGNTGELPIAVYSNDVGASFQDKELNIGDQVLDTLKDNKQLGWRFVDSKKDLVTGVRSGKYYAGIYLPKNFSDDLLSFMSGTIQKPKIEYYINEKINAIAPKITDKGASSLQEQITENFIKTASSTVIKVMNEVGYNIDSNLVSINKVKNLILTTDENAAEIEGYANQILELNDKMPEIKEKLKKAESFSAYLPEVDAMGQKVIALNDKMPELEKQAKIILTLQEKIPEIQSAGAQLAEVDSDFEQIEKTMNEGISEAKQGLEIIAAVQKILPDVESMGANAKEFAAQMQAAAEQLETTLPAITTTVKTVINDLTTINEFVSSAASEVSTALEDNQLTDEEKASLGATLTGIADRLGEKATNVGNLQNFIQDLPNYDTDTNLQNIVSQLENVKVLIQGLQTRVNNLNAAIQAGDISGATTALGAVEDFANQINAALSAINVDDIATDITKGLELAITTMKDAQSAIGKAQAIDFTSLLNNTSKTVANAVSLLEKYQQQMPAIKQEVHDANLLLNGHMNEIVEGINKGADLYNNDLPELKNKLALASDFLQNDWPGIEKEISQTMDMVDEKMPQLEAGLSMAADLIQNDWPLLKDGIHKAAEAIRKGEGEVDLGEIIKLLKADANAESDFFTNPVELDTTQMYPIENNGSASTPFYTALCLWVGALLLSSVASTEYFLEGKDKEKYSKRETFVARMLTFLTMAVAQSLVVSLGNYFLLGVDVREPVYAVLFALIVGLAFMMIVYVLAALFGNIGKGIAIIILVLSISGGGGNYPIQVSGKFFQAINPLLPFTHAVDLLRESAGGIYWPNAWPNILIMIALFVGFGVIGVLVFPKVEVLTKRLDKVSKESHFFH